MQPHFKLFYSQIIQKEWLIKKLFYCCYCVNYFGRLNFVEEFRERTGRFMLITHPHECVVNEVELSYTKDTQQKQLTFSLCDFSYSLVLRMCVYAQ